MQTNHTISETTDSDQAVDARIAIRIAVALPWLLLPTTMPCQFVENPALSALPNVKPWFVGSFAERGVITPIFDFSRWLDPDRPAHARGLIVLRDANNLIGFLSIETPRVLSFAATDAAQPNSVSLPEAFRPYAGAARAAAGETCIEFHPFAWVRANAARVPSSA